LPVGLHHAAAAAVLAASAAGADELLVGPGPVARTVTHGTYRVAVEITPNKGGLIRNDFAVRITRRGRPIRANVFVRFTMSAMAMPSLTLRLRHTTGGVHRAHGMKLTMFGRWDIRYHIEPPTGRAFDVVLTDRVRF
jgi:hypothetical protein